MFDARHLRLFGLGLVLLVVGYVCLGQGPADNHVSLSLAPLILVGTYCVLFPIALYLRPRERTNAEAQEKSGV